ncbi:MAG: hypothetical protein AAF393_10050 [Pseudomonadota bacterium]
MFAWVRLAFMALILMTIVYLCLSWYSRSVRREKLEKEFDAGGIDGDRQAFIDKGLEKYSGSLRAKLIWGVYIIPFVLIAILVYVTNFM